MGTVAATYVAKKIEQRRFILNRYEHRGNTRKIEESARPYNGIEEVVGSIPSGSTNIGLDSLVALPRRADPTGDAAKCPSPS